MGVSFLWQRMVGGPRVLFGFSLAGCTLTIAFLFIALCSPWYGEITQVEGKFQNFEVAVFTHAFYWSYYCDGVGCDSFKFNNFKSNGIYSWYDTCQDCDSQLTLYIATWCATLIATIILSILWVSHFVISYALSKGYPSKGVSLLIPILWTVSSVLLFFILIAFASSLPATKDADDSHCRRFLDAFVDSEEATNPCNSYSGSISWTKSTNSGIVEWGSATGFIFLIIALVLSPFFNTIGVLIALRVRQQASDKEMGFDYGMLPVKDVN